MQLTVNGILSDYKGRILLKQQSSRALALIGRSIESGVLPADTLARAFHHATTLVVMPVRLTGLYYNSHVPGGEVSFCFRCAMRGGDLHVPEGRPPAGFFDCPPPPPGLERRYRPQVDGALRHAGGPPYMEREGEGLVARLGRLFSERADEDEGQTWDVTARLVARPVVNGDDRQVAWDRSGAEEVWRLPGARPAAGEAPWETAARLLAEWPDWGGRIDGLSLVELAADRPAITLVFAASFDRPPTSLSSTGALTFVKLDHLTDQFAPEDVEIAGLVDRAADMPIFRLSRG